MSIYRYEEAFGAADKTTAAMRSAREKWRALYYNDSPTEGSDPCQRIGYTIVSKVVNAMFGEYRAEGKDPAVVGILAALGEKKKMALQLLLSEGECYLKPYPVEGGFAFTVVPRSNILLFGRDAEGRPNDIGTVEKTTLGKFYYTLLERRTVDKDGALTVENTLYRSQNRENLGTQVPLSTHPGYREMAERYRFTEPLGLGLVGLKTPILNCVDGSPDGVAIYAPAVGLIQNINKNESQLCGEFDRGESRVIASADLLRDGRLQDTLFVGLDDDPEQVGITVFSPQLREMSYINRKQEYLRNVESIIGLRRGMLSNADESDRTATEITSSAGDFNLVVIAYQEIWEGAVRGCIALCQTLGRLYGHIKISDPGDILFYDWQKNQGAPDHMGIVEKVVGDTITVIEGNYKNAVGRRAVKVGDTRIRGYGLPKYTDWVCSVQAVQRYLNARYEARLAADGIYGKKTKAALICALQKTLSVEETGVFTPETEEKIRKNNLRRGDRGATVEILQALLICNGFGEVYADGVFGSGTKKVLQAYQKKNGLFPDGIAGSKTFKKLCA